MSTEVIESLAKTLSGVDASRRAGWAQKYAAEARVDELSRLVNILYEQRDDMARALSWLYGMTMHFGRHCYDGALFEAIKQEVTDWDVVLDPGHASRGAAKAAEMDTVTGGKRTRQVKKMRSERAKKLASQQRRIVEKRFAWQWGFESYGDMRHFLIDLLGNPKDDPEFHNNVLREWARAATECGFPMVYDESN